jgi:hypothetical protein
MAQRPPSPPKRLLTSLPHLWQRRELCQQAVTVILGLRRFRRTLLSLNDTPVVRMLVQQLWCTRREPQWRQLEDEKVDAAASQSVGPAARFVLIAEIRDVGDGVLTGAQPGARGHVNHIGSIVPFRTLSSHSTSGSRERERERESVFACVCKWHQ